MVREPANDADNFSLMVGGPLYGIWRRTGLAGDALQFVRRRVIVLSALAWVPLLVLSILDGHAWGSSVVLPFLKDVELHARLLLALPLLVLAELVVHRRMRAIVQQFVERGIVPESSRMQFGAAIASALRLRDSVLVEVLLVVLVYVVGIGLMWRTQTALEVAGWNGAVTEGHHWRLTPAGWWLVCVSLPLFQFLLLRWYFRLFVWARLLWQVSRIDLEIMPAHPDRCGGLGFLAGVARMYSPLLLAQGIVLAGLMASRILFAGARLQQFKVELIGLVALLVLAILGPLLVFTPKLEAAKSKGMRAYGALAQRYVREYEHKWLRGTTSPDEPLLGNADIQSLADTGNTFQVLKDMRWVPFTMRTVLELAIVTLLPVLPLTLTMISFEELLDRLLKIVF